MEDQDIGFLAGFLAGEAYIGLTKNYQWKPYIQPRLSIQLHERDREVLEQFKEMIGVGKVKDRTNRDHSEWLVKKKEDLEKICNILDQCDSEMWKSSDKYENYLLWRKAVEMHIGNETTTTEERLEMAEIAKGLNKDSGHNNVDWNEFQKRLRKYES
jgi:hypothetical protein